MQTPPEDVCNHTYALQPDPRPPTAPFGHHASSSSHLQGTAGLAGLLQGLVHLEQRAALPLRYRSVNPYVASTLDDAKAGATYKLPLAHGPAGDGSAFAGASAVARYKL